MAGRPASTVPLNQATQPGQYSMNSTGPTAQGWPSAYGGFQSPGSTFQTQFAPGNSGTTPNPIPSPIPPPPGGVTPPAPPVVSPPGSGNVPPPGGNIFPTPPGVPTQPIPPRLSGGYTPPVYGGPPTPMQPPNTSGAGKGLGPIPNYGTPPAFGTPPPAVSPGGVNGLPSTYQAIHDWYKSNPFYSNLMGQQKPGQNIDALGVPVWMYGQQGMQPGPWGVGGAFLGGQQSPDSWLLPPPGGDKAYTQNSWDLYNQLGLEGKNIYDPANADAVNKMKQFLGISY